MFANTIFKLNTDITAEINYLET